MQFYEDAQKLRKCARRKGGNTMKTSKKDID